MLKKFEKWQLPDQVVFLKELPIGATGKVKKIDLRKNIKSTTCRRTHADDICETRRIR